MQIVSIHLRNIKSHRDRTFVCTPGINVLSGPNGIGKSTIFEAIGYALFGVDARDFVTNSDRFLSIGAKRGDITIVFKADDGELYQVSRSVGTPSKWLLYHQIDTRFEVEEHASSKETEKRIAQLIGLDNGRPLADQFKLVIGPFQHEFLGPFVVKQQTKRQEAFDEILGIDTWRVTYKKTADVIKTLQNQNNILSAEIQLLDEQLTALPIVCNQITTTNEAHRVITTEQEACQAELATLQAMLTTLDLTEQQIRQLETDRNRIADRITDGKQKIEDKQVDLRSSQAALKIVTDSRAGKEAYDAAEAALVDLRLREQHKRQIEETIHEAQKQRLMLEQQITHEEREIKETTERLTAEYNQIHAKLSEIPDTDDQPLLQQRIKYRTQLEELQNHRGIIIGRIQGLDEGQEQLRDGQCPWIQDRCKNLSETQPLRFFADKRSAFERDLSDSDVNIHQLQVLIANTEQEEQRYREQTLIRAQLLDQRLKLQGQQQRVEHRAQSLTLLQKQHLDAVAAVTIREQELIPYRDLANTIEASEHKRNHYQEERDRYLANIHTAEKLPELTKIITTWQQALDGLVANHQHIAQAYQEQAAQYQVDHHQNLKNKRELLVTRIATNTQKESDLLRESSRLAAEHQRLLQLHQTAEAKRREQENLVRKEQLVSFLRTKVFRHASTQLSDRFRQEISLRADRIYRSIAESDEELIWADGYQVVLRDIHNGQIRERSDDQLSGGQIMSAVVALRLAMLQTIGARIAFFDEPTSNLDAARRENLAGAFRAIDVGQEELTEHWYDQLFLISHDVAFSEITDQVIAVAPPEQTSL